MLGTIYRSGVMSDIYHSGVQFNLDYKFCSYTTNAASQSADIKLSLPAGKKITIFWGDGASTVVTGAVTETIYSHTYTDVKTYNLTVSGDYNDITYLLFDGDGSYGGDIKYMPSETLTIKRIGDNTFYGSTENLPSKLQRCGITGSVSITGIWSDVPESIISFYLTGSNTLSGDIGKNGTGLNYCNIIGYNTISDYTGKTWTTNMSTFKIVPVAPGGLSSVEMDLLLNDLNEDLDWSGGGIITLTGTNEPPGNKGIDAIENIVAEGGTVFVNDYVYSPLRATDAGAVRICDDNAIRITT